MAKLKLNRLLALCPPTSWTTLCSLGGKDSLDQSVEGETLSKRDLRKWRFIKFFTISLF